MPLMYLGKGKYIPYKEAYEYQDWYYEYNPNPTTNRSLDWYAWPIDYQGPDDNRLLFAATESDILREIREFKKDLPQ